MVIDMIDEILGRTTTTKSAKKHALNIIDNKDFYTKEDVKEAIDSVWNDKRISIETKIDLCNKLKMIYRRK